MRVKMSQGRAPTGARMIYMGEWGGQKVLGVMSAAQADWQNRGRGDIIGMEILMKHFARVGMLVEDGEEWKMVGLSPRELSSSVR